MIRIYLTNFILISALLAIILAFSACATQPPAEVKWYDVTSYGLPNGTPKTELALAKKKKVKRIEVKKGDSVYAIAKRYDIPAKNIMTLNRLKPPYNLHVGQVLKIPEVRFYEVKKGDSLYKVSRDLGIDMSSIVKYNNLKEPYMLLIGQKLRMPYENYDSEAESNKFRKKYISLKDERKKLASGDKQKEKSVESYKETEKYVSKEKLWPVKGKVISTFGAKEGGVYNDGINIAAPEGKSIRSILDGRVVYAGDGLKGYGNMMIIKHDNGWLTAYAHQKEFTVSKGDAVEKGEVIGYVGSTGNVNRPQLHFAIRKGKDAIDPMNYLPN